MGSNSTKSGFVEYWFENKWSMICDNMFNSQYGAGGWPSLICQENDYGKAVVVRAMRDEKEVFYSLYFP